MVSENRNPQSSKLTENALSKLNPADMDVSLLLNQNFLKGCGSSVKVAEGNDSNLISSFDPNLGDHSHILGTQHINFQSVARVCNTDILSVELVMKEIVAQLRH